MKISSVVSTQRMRIAYIYREKDTEFLKNADLCSIAILFTFLEFRQYLFIIVSTSVLHYSVFCKEFFRQVPTTSMVRYCRLMNQFLNLLVLNFEMLAVPFSHGILTFIATNFKNRIFIEFTKSPLAQNKYQYNSQFKKLSFQLQFRFGKEKYDCAVDKTSKGLNKNLFRVFELHK